ncbi:hypothetical protein [Phenylobacterium sp.]|uniref:hypothetical protein n=1 Tax=Phenylobacterium sp. TaxID=1871053 RepID=UPI0027338210|nr:hypothetical protein [Phenylobacterium sp.]
MQSRMGGLRIFGDLLGVSMGYSLSQNRAPACDAQEFAVSIEGEEVFRMAWKDGREARNTLRGCVRQR